MTKEELEKEACEGYIKRIRQVGVKDNYRNQTYNDGYLDGAEPREKRIAELEAQIEKMKRCEICKHYQGESCNYHSNWVKDCKENGMKLFELKEIKEK